MTGRSRAARLQSCGWRSAAHPGGQPDGPLRGGGTMDASELKHRYHDSSLAGHRVGPQRELILEIRLDRIWNPGGPETVRLRFGAIDNIDEVRKFFERLDESQAPDRVERIAPVERGKWIVELDHAGMLTIATKKLPQEQ